MKRTILGYIGHALILLLFAAAGAHAASTDLANSPLVTSASSSVRPNLMFVLDDSGSMGWDFLPDWANTSDDTLFRNNTYNGVAYNPAVTYSPPVYYNSDGTVNTTAYKSMTAGNTSNWTSVKNDGYGVQSGSNSNLVGNAFFYTFVAGEYCDKPNLKTCVTQAAPSNAYPYPATLRWCTTSALTSCQAVRVDSGSTTYTFARYPIASTTIVVSGSSSTSVTGITVNGVQILSSGTGSTTSSSTLASSIASNVGLAGFSATRSGSTVTITGPTTAIGNTPVITKSGTMTLTPAAFASAVPGSNLFTNIVSGNNSYPYPGAVAKATTRSDCTGTTCTYAEAMTNYANWWAYYHTRMQMMKTSASLAFQSVGSNYRVGYATLNNNQGNAFINLGTFDNTQKLAWYNKFFAAVPNNSTPLRATLSEIGRIYAGKYNGSSYNGVTVTDPMQYSCQQNFTILSTDGYWNEGSGFYQLNGSTNVGNQDSVEPRPFNDGGGSVITQVTPSITVVQTQTATDQTITTQWQRYVYTQGAGGSADGCNNASKHDIFRQQQRYTETKTTTVTSVNNATTTSTRTVITSNGVVTSDTTATNTNNSIVSNNTVVNSDSPPAWANFGTNTVSSNCTTSGLPSPNPSSPSVVTTNTLTTSGPTTTVVSTTGPTTGATTTTTTSTGGTSNTLSDVSEYFYTNDLRTAALGNCTGSPIPPAVAGLDVCTDDVPQSGLDGASWQHMTTFTLGLGASGFMQFGTNYANASSGDFFDVKNGTTANPAGGICSWQSSGACNWPAPVSNEQTTIDDLWHAAVNGRGTYFSATNPASLNSGLSSALAGVSARTGSSAAATTSNPNVTSGDNFVFSSTFTTNTWDGELVRQQLDLVTGVVSNTVDWSARDQLDANASRVLYTFDGAAGNKLKTFNWASLSVAQQAYFSLPAISPLSQFCVSGATCLSAADQTAASGQPVVDFLRGDRTNEGVSTDISKYFRARGHILGDIVNAEAVYVKKPLYNYADAGYSAYINVARQGMVYAAGNDGMLHAFNATTGAESWAYVPTLVMPNLYKLADKNYSANHRYFVDGTPVSGDVYFGGTWHTIVVGGMNAGGRGYYALDVTTPASPVALWEYTEANMGYTYGNPTITKLADGTWVVLVTSGYNNVPDTASVTGDGVGRLYVLNASTGALIRSISTGVGSTTTPSGLARVSAWVTNATSDNTALRAYGGDLLGNMWRFDINGNVGAAGYDAQKMVTAYANSAGTITQPITTRPELGDVAGVAVVYFGTGRFLGVVDLTDTTLQTFYAVKDTLGTTTYTNPQASGSNFVQQVVSNTTCPAGSPATICTLGQSVRTSTSNTVNFATNNGWYVNLPDSGERANTDPNLALGTLGFTTNVPNTSACTAGGYSYRYVLDYRTGAPVSTSTTGVSAIKLGNALSTRGVFVRLPNNTVVQLTRLSDGTTMTTNVPIGAGVAPVRRVSWRELIQDQ